MRRVRRSDFALITTHFNPQRFRRLRETYYQWRPTIEVPVICYEMVLGDAEPEIDGSVVIRGDENNLLWQKERLINLAIERLPISVALVIQFTGPLMVLLWLRTVHGRRLRPSLYGAVALSVAGSALVVEVYDAGSIDGLGIAFSLVAAITFAIYPSASSAPATPSTRPRR
jgi:hypothetical protein